MERNNSLVKDLLQLSRSLWSESNRPPAAKTTAVNSVKVPEPYVSEETLSADFRASRSATEATVLSDYEEKTHVSESSAPSEDSAIAISNDRYQSLALLGTGGMGIVLRVKDRLLNRNLAMKILHKHLMDIDSNATRFMQEAQVCAQLQHPNILPVHDLGLLDDGRIFITMTEIRGDSFADHIFRVHEASRSGMWNSSKDNWNVHRLMSAYHDVCKAVSYAHDHNVIHRDIKPSNVMVGTNGEVLLVDWGVAKVLGVAETSRPVETVTTEQAQGLTRYGGICGTPSYIAPELAADDAHTANIKTDIYALGVMLFEILRGQRPYRGTSYLDILHQIAHSEPDSLYQQPTVAAAPVANPISIHGAPVPPVLAKVCGQAMARSPEERFDSVAEILQVVGAWLDGSKKREKALELVNKAQLLSEEVKERKTNAEELRSDADALRASVQPWQPEEEKQEIWKLEEMSQTLALDSLMKRTHQVQLYRSALAHKGDLPEAHYALAMHYRALHEQAEFEGNADDAHEAEIVLCEHVEALPDSHPQKSDLVKYLQGHGKVVIETVPEGANLTLCLLEKYNRRFVLGPNKRLGSSPVVARKLTRGSYLLKLEKEGYHDTVFPIYNRRLSTTEGLHPDGVRKPIVLLPNGSLGKDDCYVPAGWCWLGGDSNTPNSLPSQRVWIEGFVMRRFPVTHVEYLDYLNHLVESGQPEQAELHAPREQSSSEEELGQMVYLRDSEGRFKLPTDPHRSICWPNQPVTMIQWRSARAYAGWQAEMTGKPWRLPMEFEWEKAARGVDARYYPWGDDFDPSWACMKDSHKEEVKMYDVDSFPNDVSVYGVRGTAGNTRDWCLDRYREEGPPVKDGLLLMPSEEDLEDPGFKSTRGGSYGNSASRSRSADRDWWFPERSYVGRGFRLVWGLADVKP